jgi:small conductance mechanosensitive channel
MDPNTSVAKGMELGPEMVQTILNKLSEFISAFGLKIIGAIAIIIIGRWIAHMLSGFLKKAMAKAKIDDILVSFAESLTYVGLMVFIIIAALGVVGIPTASFAAVIAAAGLAIGLALQGSLSNFAAGVLMVIFKPIRVGDFVEVGGALGTVKKIQIFNTILDSPDNVRIIVPNAQVTGSHIKNYTINGTRRVDLVIGVSYEDDLKKTCAVIEKVLANHELVLKNPAPTVAVSELADSSVNLVVRPWVKAVDYWTAYFGLTEAIKVALDKNGITIPFPQHDVHMIPADGAKAE